MKQTRANTDATPVISDQIKAAKAFGTANGSVASRRIHANSVAFAHKIMSKSSKCHIFSPCSFHRGRLRVFIHDYSSESRSPSGSGFAAHLSTAYLSSSSSFCSPTPGYPGPVDALALYEPRVELEVDLNDQYSEERTLSLVGIYTRQTRKLGISSTSPAPHLHMSRSTPFSPNLLRACMDNHKALNHGYAYRARQSPYPQTWPAVWTRCQVRLGGYSIRISVQHAVCGWEPAGGAEGGVSDLWEAQRDPSVDLRENALPAKAPAIYLVHSHDP
ncbi:hypothetical protein C8F01DRAFT_1081457 [Mycena amicta]|nr:hypothetical protein C8F01DRAFT_1081457 [Mycena amicta]